MAACNLFVSRLNVCNLILFASCIFLSNARQLRFPSEQTRKESAGIDDGGHPKNVLILMADQFRFDHLTEELTPNLMALAARGANFRRAYSSVPICPAARASMLTGLSPWKHGLRGYGDIAPHYKEELPSFFTKHGYTTAAIGKNHFGVEADVTEKTESAKAAEQKVDADQNIQPRKRITHGYEHMEVYDGLNEDFDDYDRWFQKERPNEDPMKSGGLSCAAEMQALQNGSGSNGRRPDWCWNAWRGAPVYEYEERLHPTQWIADRALQWLHSEKLADKKDVKEGKTRQPWFLKVSFHRPHSPYDPPSRVFNSTPTYSGEHHRSSDGWDESFRDCKAKNDPDTWCGEVPGSDLSISRRSYAASVKHVDEQAGRVLEAIDPATTWVLFVSDHGEMHGDHFLWRKSVPYEGATHVPFVLAWPTSLESMLRPGPRDHLIELRDVFPTLAGVNGLLSSDDATALDGIDLTCALIETDKPCGRRLLDLEHGNNWDGLQPYRWNALTDGEMKYIRFAKGSVAWDWPQEQLFNLSADPREDIDLVRTASPSDADALLAPWRFALAQQFEREKRGTDWVSAGTVLVGVPAASVLSPHYPVGTSILLQDAHSSQAAPPPTPALEIRRQNNNTAMTLSGPNSYDLIVEGSSPSRQSTILSRRVPHAASFGLGATFTDAPSSRLATPDKSASTQQLGTVGFNASHSVVYLQQ